MGDRTTHRFSQQIDKIGINPYVEVPLKVVRGLLHDAKKSTGPVPVKGKLNGKKFIQTVVKFRGLWRLYLNTAMRRDAGIDVEDKAVVELSYDPAPRTVPTPQRFSAALAKNKSAKSAFKALRPSHQKEILRYLGFLKSEEALERNVQKIISKLTSRNTDDLLWRRAKRKFAV